MGLFTTRRSLGYVEQKVEFRALFLELFFHRTVNFHIEEVMLDKVTGETPVAAYVSPVVEGKVLHHRSGETRVLCPDCIKPKHEFNYQRAVERLPGEDPSQLNDPTYRRLRIITDNLKQEEHAIVQVEEVQAVNVVLYGKYTMEEDQSEKTEVDFGRSTKDNITQGSGKEWLKQGRDTLDPTHDTDFYYDLASGLVNIAIVDGTVWRLLNGFKLSRERLDTCRGSNPQLEAAARDLSTVVSLKGYYGDLVIVMAKISYIAEDGIEKRYPPNGILVLGNITADGIRYYGAIQDAQTLSEDVVASSRYPKHWLTVGDPTCEFTMTQSAPLMVLPDPDKFAVVRVEQPVSGGEMPPYLFSQGADMTTREQDLKRLDKLALILGHGPGMSGSAVEIAQRVVEWEEEVQSPDDDTQAMDMNIRERETTTYDIRKETFGALTRIKVLTYLHPCNVDGETGEFVELVDVGRAILTTSSDVKTHVDGGTAVYA